MDPTGWLMDMSNPEDVARATFPIVRRGFDPIEVQGFARSVSAEITRLRHHCNELEKALTTAEAKANERLTEATVAGFLGEEAARMLEASREAAAMAIVRAEHTAEQTLAEADEYASRTVAAADGHAERVTRQTRIEGERRRREVDEYANRVRAEADEYVRNSVAQADADADATHRRAELDAQRIVQDALDHRTTLLRELVRRRDLASAQIRQMMAGRDLVVEALAHVGALVTGVTEGLQEIGTAPADFVQLDPEVEGVASEANVVVAVNRTPKSARGKAPAVRETAALGAG
jgi:cell division septum initiation protein DivIVA